MFKNDIKVHYSNHGGERCALIDRTFNNLYGVDYIGFADFLKDEFPQLFKLQTLRVYSSLGRTKVLYAISLVVLGAKAKFLQRKPSALVALEEISEMC